MCENHQSMTSRPIAQQLRLWVLASLTATLAALVVSCASSQGAETTAKQYTDPAPPKIEQAPDIPAPASQNNPAVTFHRKPKPLPAGAVTHDWTSFLGPTHNAVSTETKLLRAFPPQGPPLVWEMRKGTGYSSPAISGDRLVFLHREGSQEFVECLHPESGERYWQFSYRTKFQDRYGYNNGPRASPVIDGDRVYTYGAQGKLHCFRLATGQILWRRDLSAEFKVPQDFFGTATTPLIENDLLIINVGAPGGPTVAAFDKTNGKMAWGAGSEWGPSYATPVAADVHGRRRVFVFAGGESRPPSGGLLVIDPADGRIDFAFPWRSRSYESVNASTPLVIGSQVFLSATYRAGAALLNLSPGGGHDVAWTSPEFDLHFTMPIHRNGYLYGFAGRNEPDASLMAVELATGKTVWREVPEWQETIEVSGSERTISASTYRGSLLWADGRFLALGEHGHLLWLDLSPKGYKQLARARLFRATETWTPPVLSRGLLYIVQNHRDTLAGTRPRLLCYDLRAEK
jgi:outer membrane protein assembly factor BamB